jgi:subtilisin-like proprotein convertase family protein
MKKLLLTFGTIVTALSASAILYTSTPNSAVPDANYSGWANSINITGQSGTILPGSLQVNLTLANGWNGDLYAYLVNSSGGFCVLLDRVGFGEDVGSYGYGDAGVNVTFSATGANGSIHSYGGNVLHSGAPSGPYQPDASGITSSPGTLSSFVNPNGTWTLFVADMCGGSVSTVQSWGLQMDIVAVPEVESWIAAALAGAFGAFWLNRQIWGGRQSACNFHPHAG